MEFTIGRDGTIKDIRMVQSSGNMSMDNSGATRAASVESFAGVAVGLIQVSYGA